MVESLFSSLFSLTPLFIRIYVGVVEVDSLYVSRPPSWRPLFESRDTLSLRRNGKYSWPFFPLVDFSSLNSTKTQFIFVKVSHIITFHFNCTLTQIHTHRATMLLVAHSVRCVVGLRFLFLYKMDLHKKEQENFAYYLNF